jgi:ubiquinone/menaquinone biosynthesis C-methylase UbiE
MPTAGWWEALWPNPAAVIAAVGIAPGMDVVDLCCGDGWFTLQIAKVASRVLAVDIDPHMLEIARHRLAEGGVSNSAFTQSNAYDLQELMHHRVDFVFMANAFHGVPDKPRLARTVSDILRAQGRFATVNWHQLAREETTVLGEPRGPKSELRLTPEQTVGTVEAGGLKLAAHMEIPPYHYALVFERARSQS